MCAKSHCKRTLKETKEFNMQDRDVKEAKLVIYKHYETPKIWVWEIHGVDEKIHYHGEESSFDSAYEIAKKNLAKYNRKHGA
jgi:hypothetical protein